MKRYWIIGLVAVIALSAISIIGSYNRMVTMVQEVDGAWAQVNTQLQRRYDLIPNLVNTVKGYAAHEQAAIQAVTDARAAMMGATTPAQQQAAAAELEGALGRLLVVVENYPDLKADGVFMDLMDQLSGTENRIAQFRMLFNDEVKGYNAYVARFPNLLWARMFGFQQKSFFELTNPQAIAPPQVTFP